MVITNHSETSGITGMYLPLLFSKGESDSNIRKKASDIPLGTIYFSTNYTFILHKLCPPKC
ncbi:hypothetical protein AHMF7616_04432 [Adhaeribacter pallidiroseus]|uniref:Uncharacterized protein n=1 Tax=Adhaeribacter pallidiroseus TaxID=2072847 RepID=A0A369QN93_9BACT|nr:hypothetical protein AHMF7616_04432 [Adhaeribacter pallidiroseus]